MISSLELNPRRDQTRRMLAKILGHRVYLNFSSELPELPVPENLSGCASGTLWSTIRDQRPMDYFGQAPGILVFDNHLRNLSASEAAVMLDNIVCHEAAHVLCSIVAGEVTADRPQQLATELATDWRELKSHKGGPLLWLGHDAKFIRALCHTFRRMQNRGYAVCLEIAFSHTVYGLSPASTYLEALGGEPEENDWVPLAEVLAKPAPMEFTTFWQSDCLRCLTKPVENGVTK